jgi:hypothetical protein
VWRVQHQIQQGFTRTAHANPRGGCRLWSLGAAPPGGWWRTVTGPWWMVELLPSFFSSWIFLFSSWIARREAAHTGGHRLCPETGGVPHPRRLVTVG